MTTLLSRLKEFDKNLLPDMVQLKYELMSQNAFRFFRGTCHLFYEDLSKAKHFQSSPSIWACGDLHIENFGSFKGNNRMVYFDLNDFDEAMLSPLLWELSRVITSIFVAFDSLKITPSEAKRAAELFLLTYSEVLSAGKAYSIDPRTAKGVVKRFLKNAEKKKETDLIERVIKAKCKKSKINIDNKTHFKIERELRQQLKLHVNNYIRQSKDWLNNYDVKDIAFRVAGTGSVGLKRYMFLLRSNKTKRKYILVEMKEGVESSLKPFNKISQPTFNSQADRIVSVKKRMQNISPAMLNVTVFNKESFVLQEMQPASDKFNFDLIAVNTKYLEKVIKDMAVLTASAQIRSSGRQGSCCTDELIAFGNEKKWQQPLLDYSFNYAMRMSEYYTEFSNLYHSGEFLPVRK